MFEGAVIFVPFSDGDNPPGTPLGTAPAEMAEEPLSLDPLATLCAKLLLDLDIILSLWSTGASLAARPLQLPEVFTSEVETTGSEGLRS